MSNRIRAKVLHISVAADYQWSSARAHLGVSRDRSGILDLGFWERAGGVETWREMHAAVDDSERILLLQRCTYAGRPIGEEGFGRSGLENQFQRHWRRWEFEKLATGA